jgi:hypothetical protein
VTPSTLGNHRLSTQRGRWPLLARFLPLFATLAILLAGLSACGSTAIRAPDATPTPTAIPWETATPGTVLFQSDWSKGLDGWQASDGWAVRDGMLEIDGNDNRTLTIPYQPKVRDYAVVFSAQVVDEPKDGGYFRLVVAPQTAAPGFYAEVEGLHTDIPHQTGDHPHARVVFDPFSAQDPASGRPLDYEPHHTLTIYRVEVHDNVVQFATDKATLTGAFTRETKPLSHGPLTLVCGLALLRFGQIQVVAL